LSNGTFLNAYHTIDTAVGGDLICGSLHLCYDVFYRQFYKGIAGTLAMSTDATSNTPVLTTSTEFF